MEYNEEGVLSRFERKDLESVKHLIDSLLAHLKTCVEERNKVDRNMRNYPLLSSPIRLVSFNCDRGICGNLAFAFAQIYGIRDLTWLIRHCFERYEKFSGSYYYPIGGNDEYQKPHWEGESLFNRMSLLKFMSSHLTKLIEKAD